VFTVFSTFYRVMLRRARYCYGKVVCPWRWGIVTSWSHRLEFLRDNFTIS